MMLLDDEINVLRIHLDNLNKCSTLEQYKQAHSAYIKLLINCLSAESDCKTAVEAFAMYEVPAEVKE